MDISINFDMLDEPIEITHMTSIVIENKKIFSRIVQDLYAYEYQEEINIKLFDSSFKNIHPSEVMIVTDILKEELNSPAVLKLVYKDVEEHISIDPGLKTQIEDALGQAWNLINREMVHFDLDLTSDKMTLQDAFKAMSIKIDSGDSSIYEKTLEIIHLCKYLTKKKLLVLINLSTYLNVEEMQEVEEYSRLQNIKLLLIDNAAFIIRGSAKQVIIDDDFIVMRVKS